MDDAPLSDDQDEKLNIPVVWNVVQSFFILAALATAIAVLVVAVQDRELAHKAFKIASAAAKINGTTLNQVSQLSMVGDYPNASKISQLGTDVASLQEGTASLKNGVAGIQKGVTNLTESFANVSEKVDGLASKVHVLQSATHTTTSTSSSASASASEYAWSSGVKQSPQAAVGLVLVEWIVAILL